MRISRYGGQQVRFLLKARNQLYAESKISGGHDVNDLALSEALTTYFNFLILEGGSS